MYWRREKEGWSLKNWIDQGRYLVNSTSKLLSEVSNDFKMYHFAIVDQFEGDAEEVVEQEILDQHGIKVLELVDRIGQLVKEPL